MNSNTISNGILKALGLILGVFLVLYFLYKIQSIIVYIAIGAVISLIGRPIVLFLRRRLKIPLIVEQGQNLSLLNIEELQQNVEGLYREAVSYFELKSIDVEQSLKDSNLLGKIDYSVIPNFLNSIISGFGSFSIGLFSVFPDGKTLRLKLKIYYPGIL